MNGEHPATEPEIPSLAILIGEAETRADGLRRIPVALITRGYKGKQKFTVTASDLTDIVENFRKRKADVVIDYEHSTLAKDGKPTPSAGWLKAIDDGPDNHGVLWGWADYTEAGARSVAAKDYKYASPVIEWGRRDKETGEQQGATLTSLALVKQPLFEGLPELPLVASDGWHFERGDAVERKDRDVKIIKVVAGAAGKVRLVADDNTETEMAIEGLRVLTVADLKRGSDKRFDFSALPHGDDVLIGSDVLHAMNVQAAVDAAVEKGKVLPAQREQFTRLAAADLEGFQTLVTSMTPQIDLRVRGTGTVQGETAASADVKVSGLVKEKIVASDGEMGYQEAMRLVLEENPELAREYKAGMGREQ